LHPLDACCSEHRLRRITIEHELHAAEVLSQIIERARDDDAPVVDDRNAIGDLVHFRDLMGGEEHRHALAGHMRDECLENLLGRYRIESRGRLVEHQQLRAAG
jgi:hypothetical protein